MKAYFLNLEYTEISCNLKIKLDNVEPTIVILIEE